MSTITLPNIRVSSDLTVRVRLKDGGVAIDWSTLNNIKAHIYSDAQRALAGRCGVSVDAEDPTILVCTYAANKPQYVGVNRIVVSARYMGEMKTYDKPAFSFVRWTADQEGEEITIDDPDVDVEIEVEDVTSSILQEAINAALQAAADAEHAAHLVPLEVLQDCEQATQDANEAAAAANAAGITSVQVSVEDNEPGTPSAECSLANKVLSVIFHYLKGETGDAAGFGTITATCVEDGGDPSVLVTLSGPDTAKNIAFTLKNFKGDKGDKGDQGNTGSSVDYPYELVNNCTTDDATKGLAASQGVALQAEVSQLEAKVDEKIDGILNLGQWEVGSFNYPSNGHIPDLASNTRIRVSEQTIQETGTYNLSCNNGYKFVILVVDKLTTWDWYDNLELELEQGDIFRVAIKTDPETDFSGYTQSQVDALVVASGFKMVGTGIQKELDELSGKVETIDERVETLEHKTSEISKQDIEEEDESFTIENDNQEVLFKVDDSGVEVKNLKCNGQDILQAETVQEVYSEEVDFVSNDETQVYARISKDGTASKVIWVCYDDTLSVGGKISCEKSFDFADKITITDDENTPIASFEEDGVRVSSLRDMDGSIIPFERTIYVSPDGNDSNTGASTSPLATINTALSRGANTIILLPGVYDQTIDLTLSAAQNIVIKGTRDERVIFKKADSLICDSGEEALVSGYTKVYKLTGVQGINYGAVSGRAEWLFFDNLEDVNTAINKSEAHPMERGMFCRCDCTKSIKTTATTLSDALNEIESTLENEYKWFYDNGDLYFNRPDSTSVYALYKSVGNYFTTRNNQSLTLSNIEFRYGNVNLKYMNIVKVYNCASKCVYGMGAFSYDFTVAIEFIRCEAALCFSGLNGDGFNAAAESSTADYRSIRNQALMIDCWSHDNNDDGFSDHEFGESTIIGGLFEYNKKAGITPASGSHCTCYNVYSRHNYSGFAYVGQVNDRGNEGQIMCHNCVSEKNDRGGNKCGYIVVHGNNRMLLFGCIAIDENVGYKCSPGCYMDLYDCKTLRCTTKTQSEGTMSVNNCESI